MKRPTTTDLDAEYVPNAASAARERERARMARWQAQTAEREARARAWAAEQARQQAQPIDDDAALSDAVADLAAAWGLKRKRRSSK